MRSAIPSPSNNSRLKIHRDGAGVGDFLSQLNKPLDSTVCAWGVRLPTEIMEELGLALEVDPGFFTTMLIPRDSPSIVGRYMQKRVVAP